MARIGPLLKISRPLQTGAQRLVDGITNPGLPSGVFYASAANPTYQDNPTKPASSPT